MEKRAPRWLHWGICYNDNYKPTTPLSTLRQILLVCALKQQLWSDQVVATVWKNTAAGTLSITGESCFTQKHWVRNTNSCPQMWTELCVFDKKSIYILHECFLKSLLGHSKTHPLTVFKLKRGQLKGRVTSPNKTTHGFYPLKNLLHPPNFFMR